MKNIEYNIPIFESKDLADLNLYSEKMAAAIKGQIDKFGNPLVFQGIKQSKSELDLISNPQSGDIYGVIETNKNYIWNSKEWVVYSEIMELDNYYNKKEIDKKLSEVEGNEVYIGNEEEAPETAKIIVEEDDFVGSSTLSKAEVYVGAEEPITGEKVWFRKGKNKFNPNDKTKGYLNTDGSFTSATDWMCSGFIEINSDKYILSANTTAKRVIWCEYDSSMNIIGRRHEVVYGNPIAIVSTNTKYIKVCFNDGTATDIQLEQGSKATSYEAYIEPKIFVRNSNGVYEEFKENEFVKTDIFTAKSGYEISNQRIYKQGKHYFGNVIVHKTSGNFSSTNENPISSSISTRDTINSFCCLSNVEYGATGLGYFYMNNKDVIIYNTNSLSCSYAKINIDFVEGG